MPKRSPVWIPKWKSLLPPYQVGQDGFTESDVISDAHGWVNPEDIKPLPYALCFLRTEKECFKGWWDSKGWEGYRLKKKEKILYWKKMNESSHRG